MTDVPLAIETGIPVPSRYSTWAQTEFPFSEMQIGDSFFVSHVTISKLLMVARKFRPKRFTARTVVERGVRGVRIWRLE